MPILQRPGAQAARVLPARRAEVLNAVEVLIVGGGPAGIGAALGAAKAGARTALIEHYGFLGGSATAALVSPIMSPFAGGIPFSFPSSLLFPGDHGLAEPLIAGAFVQLIERLIRNQGALPPSAKTGFVIPFDPETFKLSALELVDEAGVQFLLHGTATGCLIDQHEHGIIFETKSGALYIPADVVVDCTGDGDVSALAGATFEIGREDDGQTQPMTLYFRMQGFDQAKFAQYVRENPDQWESVHGLWKLVDQATHAGDLHLPREDILMFATNHPNEVSVNCTRFPGLGVDAWDLTAAEWETRKQAHQISEFLRRYVPGFAHAYMDQTATEVGIRETRRITGEYHLTKEDVLGARKFEDVVARCAYPIDIHNPSGKGTHLERLPPGEWYDIPLGCLIPKGIDRILTAGRCISGTHEAHSSFRTIPTCVATGQAAGVCAALASRSKKPVREVPVKEVQSELVRQGADLD